MPSTAGSSTIEGKKKWKRASGPRTRTGCITCKIRHVKCDEGKPTCLRCKTNFVKCDGYAPAPSTSARHSRESTVVSPAGTSPSSALVYLAFPVVVDVVGAPDERRSFHHFRVRTADCISGYFTSNFWNRLVLQLGHTEPAIKHALVALGAAHEQYERGAGSNGPSGQLALQQYSKAINSLSERLSNPSGRTSEVSLICCVLFICLESVQGNFDAVITHLSNGLKILKGWRANGKKMITADRSMAETPYLDAKTDEDELVQLFSSLDISVTAFFDKGPPQMEGTVNDPTTFFDNTGKFYSLEHARTVVQRLENAVFYFMTTSFLFRGMPADQVPTKIKAYRCALIECFNRWTQQFDVLMKTPEMTNLSGRALHGTCMLVIHQKTMLIILKCAPYATLDMFTPYTDEFKVILSLISGILNSSSSSSPDVPNRPVSPEAESAKYFTFEMGLIAPLYYVALNCQDKQVRYQAIALLYKCHRREGIWDSQMVAQLCEKVVREILRDNFDIREMEGGLPEIAQMFKSSNADNDDFSSISALSKREYQVIDVDIAQDHYVVPENLSASEYIISLVTANQFLGEELDSVAFEENDTLPWM